MTKTLLLTFDDQENRQKFMQVLQEAAATMTSEDGPNVQNASEGWEQRKANGELIQKAVSTAVTDPPIKSDTDRICALFVSGKKLVDGNLADLNKRFELEVGSHSGSVEIREKRGDEWTTVRRRMRSQM